MRCPYHLLKEVVGYCSVCGSFGCAECITQHENILYCKTHFKPIADRLVKQKKHEELLSRPERQRLVIHKKDGTTLSGVSFALNHKSDGFHLDMVDGKGETIGKSCFLPFEDLKAIFYVKSYDGKFDESQRFKEWKPEGNAVVVEFLDGELIHGHTMHPYRSSEPRFFLVPHDEGSNNISILIERSAIGSVLSPEDYKAKKVQEIEDYLEKHKATAHSREELTGDYHFERKEYGRASRCYQTALEKGAETKRLHKKLSLAHYNIGTRHIKQHEYARAYSCMKLAVEQDPTNERAVAKYEKLREYLKKKQRREPTGSLNSPK